MDKSINNLFIRFAKAIDMPMIGEREQPYREGHVFKNDYIIMDFNSIYGGYVIMIVDKDSSQRAFDGYDRKTKKEMVAYLMGFLTGIYYKK